MVYVQTAYGVVTGVIDVWYVRCKTHTLSRSGALHVVTVAFFRAARKILFWEFSSPHASVIVCDVTHVSIDAMCVYVWLSYICYSTHGYVHVNTDVSDTHRQCLDPGQRSVLLVAFWLLRNPQSMPQQACGCSLIHCYNNLHGSH